MGYKIIDNFLKDDLFKQVKERFYSDLSCPWYFHKSTVQQSDLLPGDSDIFQFVHVLCKSSPIEIERYDLKWFHSGDAYIKDVLEKLNPYFILRIKANMTVASNNQAKSAFHLDDNKFVKSRIKYSIGIYYLNTCDGYTILKDGTKIESIENRMLLLSGDTLHAACPPSYGNRVVINFNFINSETASLYDHLT